MPFGRLLAAFRRARLVFDPLVSLLGHVRRRPRPGRSGGCEGRAPCAPSTEAAFRLPDLVLADTWAHAAYYQAAFGASLAAGLPWCRSGRCRCRGADGGAARARGRRAAHRAPVRQVEPAARRRDVSSRRPSCCATSRSASCWPARGSSRRRCAATIAGRGARQRRVAGRAARRRAARPDAGRRRLPRRLRRLRQGGARRAQQGLRRAGLRPAGRHRRHARRPRAAARRRGRRCWCRPATPAALAAALRRLLDGGERARLGARGARRCTGGRSRPPPSPATLLAALERPVTRRRGTPGPARHRTRRSAADGAAPRSLAPPPRRRPPRPGRVSWRRPSTSSSPICVRSWDEHRGLRLDAAIPAGSRSPALAFLALLLRAGRLLVAAPARLRRCAARSRPAAADVGQVDPRALHARQRLHVRGSRLDEPRAGPGGGARQRGHGLRAGARVCARRWSTIAVLFPFWEYRPGVTALEPDRHPRARRRCCTRACSARWPARALRLLRRPPLDVTLRFRRRARALLVYFMRRLARGRRRRLAPRRGPSPARCRRAAAGHRRLRPRLRGRHGRRSSSPAGSACARPCSRRRWRRQLPGGVALAWALLLRLWVTVIELVFVGLVVGVERCCVRRTE